MRRLPIGMRNVKTGVAVFCCLALYALVGRDNAVFACIAVVFSMLDTVQNSIQYGINRAIGTVVGGTISIGVMELNALLPAWAAPLTIGLGVMLVILVCNLLGKKIASTSAAVVFLIITITTDGSASYAYAIKRSIDTLVGIVIAVAVNHLLGDPGKKQGEATENNS